MDDNTQPKHLNDMSFNEALASTANQDKSSLVLATIDAFKKGEPSAIKLVTSALLEQQFTEESALPINDKRYIEIICLAADAFRAGEI